MNKVALAFATIGAIAGVTYADEYNTSHVLANADNKIQASGKQQTPPQQQFAYDFASDVQGWQGGFADYPQGQETLYELDFTHSQLPPPLDQQQGAIKLTGNNHSDDLFMFAKRKITGLIPKQSYQATFKIQIATNVADGTFGVGGSPGESVFIKAGLTKNEPLAILDSSNDYRMNIDKGIQAEGGQDMVLIGDFANGTSDNVYTFKDLTNTTPFVVQANDDGELWAIVGSDSGFEATTTIYYNKIALTLQPSSVQLITDSFEANTFKPMPLNDKWGFSWYVNQ